MCHRFFLSPVFGGKCKGMRKAESDKTKKCAMLVCPLDLNVSGNKGWQNSNDMIREYLLKDMYYRK